MGWKRRAREPQDERAVSQRPAVRRAFASPRSAPGDFLCRTARAESAIKAAPRQPSRHTHQPVKHVAFLACSVVGDDGEPRRATDCAGAAVAADWAVTVQTAAAEYRVTPRTARPPFCPAPPSPIPWPNASRSPLASNNSKTTGEATTGGEAQSDNNAVPHHRAASRPCHGGGGAAAVPRRIRCRSGAFVTTCASSRTSAGAGAGKRSV